jgi:hypothetical protein
VIRGVGLSLALASMAARSTTQDTQPQREAKAAYLLSRFLLDTGAARTAGAAG